MTAEDMPQFMSNDYEALCIRETVIESDAKSRDVVRTLKILGRGVLVGKLGYRPVLDLRLFQPAIGSASWVGGNRPCIAEAVSPRFEFDLKCLLLSKI
jgi:hypothetical protein